MGSGIAQVSAQAGINVTMVDVNQQALDKSLGAIENSVARVVRKKFSSNPEAGKDFTQGIMKNIKTSTNMEQSVENSELVIEAIVENLEIKKDMFKTIDQAAPADCIFATNTSSLSVADCAASVSPDRLPNFGGLHFFNPVPMMKLLEVVQADFTSDATFQKMWEYGEAIKKVNIKCMDTPGFVLNRLLIAYNQEANRMYQRGHASIKDIDTAMKYGCGYPMGPFELQDYTGLDVAKFVNKVMHERNPGNPVFDMDMHIVNKLVENGDFGIKSGKGFYDYTSGKRVEREDLKDYKKFMGQDE